MNNSYHLPVLLTEIVKHLDPKSSMRFIDATFGGGGHATALAQKGAQILGLDQDQDAIDRFTDLSDTPTNITLVHSNFSQIGTVAKQNGFDQVDGILFDLGVSSWQLDQPDRGFSFQSDSALDMRMDKNLAVTAADLLAALSAGELEKLLKVYGDEPKARQIAQAIVTTRTRTPITTTNQLARIVEKIHSHRGKIHPATKVFQALRIAVNDELNSLKTSLQQSVELLKPGGIIAVISFHSGEDRIVKHFLNNHPHLTPTTKKPITPTQSEINQNHRSRSAKLRLAHKHHDPAQQKNHSKRQSHPSN